MSAAKTPLQILGQSVQLADDARILLLAPGPHGVLLSAGLRGRESAFHWTVLDSALERIKSLNQPLTNQAARPARFVRAKASRLPFRRHSFEAVIALEALYSIRPPWTLIAEFHRVLVPDGKLLLVEPQRQGFFSMLRDKISGPGKRVFSLEEIKYRMARGDYAIDDIKTLGAIKGMSQPAYLVHARKLENAAEPAPQFLTAKEMMERRKNKLPKGEQLP